MSRIRFRTRAGGRRSLVSVGAVFSRAFETAGSPAFAAGASAPPRQIHSPPSAAVTTAAIGADLLLKLTTDQVVLADGRQLYASRCLPCHGDKGQGSESVPLVGGIGSLTTDKPLKTVGSYWPYATTVFDYTRRAMPFDRPGTLTDDQVYAVVAFVLHLNGIVEENQVLDAQTLPQVKMPNRDGFIPDTRPDVPKK